ncbi:MAG: ABC transporter permease [Geminicoccaceae bacterium]
MSGLIKGARGEIVGLLVLLALVVALFGLTTPRFWGFGTFQSMAFQLPELGLLTLAMLIPILSGGLNLAITFQANICALALAATLQALGGPDAGGMAFFAGVIAALAVGVGTGFAMGTIVARTGAHPILVSLGFMIFLRGIGEYLTRGGDVSGFPPFVATLGHGALFGLPIPLILFGLCALAWQVLLRQTRLGFSIHMVGSNVEASHYAAIDTRRVLTLVYTLSGLMCAIAGIIMAARFNSVRVGHGEAYLLITVLACFLGGVDPFGGFGRTISVVLALVILQVISTGLNLLGANQHLATGLWGAFLILVMVFRWLLRRYLIRGSPNV